MASVLVHIEMKGDEPTAPALATLGQGRQLASELGATLYAVAHLAGGTAGSEKVMKTLGASGADRVILFPASSAGPALWHAVGSALVTSCDHVRPSLVLFPASPSARDVAPRLATHLGAAYVPDAEIAVSPQGDLSFARLVYGGGYRRRLTLDDVDQPVVATVPRRSVEHRGDDLAELLMLESTASPSGVSYLRRRAELAPEDLLELAKVVVVGGAGVPAALWPQLEQLAQALGGELGATGGACELGHAPRARQVGRGGRCVAPRLYLAIGASGSASHLEGISPGATIVAINSNAEAPIFKVSTYGLIGAAEEIVPALLSALGERS